MSHEHDWIEGVRAKLYPALHNLLKPFGFYAEGHVSDKQYVATFHVDEEEIEKLLLHRAKWERNPIAAYKSHYDGRESTLSLRLTHDTDTTEREYVEPGMQLHVTLFPVPDGRKGTVECYAHYEDDWLAAPLSHLRSKNLSAKEGVKRMLSFLRHETFFEDGVDYTRHND